MITVVNEDSFEGWVKGIAPATVSAYYLLSRDKSGESVRSPATGLHTIYPVFQLPLSAPNGIYSIHFRSQPHDSFDTPVAGGKALPLVHVKFGVPIGELGDVDSTTAAQQVNDTDRELYQHTAATQANRQNIDLGKHKMIVSELADGFALNRHWRVETASQAKALSDLSRQMAADASMHMRTFREMQEMQADALKAIRGQLRMEPSEGGGGGGALTGAVGAIRELILLARGVVGGRGAGEEGQEAMSSLFESMGGKKKKKKNKRDKGDPVDRVRQQAESAPSAAEIDEMMSALRQVRDAKEQAAKQGQEAKSAPAEESPENKP